MTTTNFLALLHMLVSLLDKWHRTFGSASPEVIVRAPGRVNIIGEHTDYNEGWVLPGAMSRYIYILISRNEGAGHHWIASDLDQEIQMAEQVIEYGEYSWARYIQGAISLYSPGIGPLRMLIGGDLPVGAGISSSSALVCGVLFGLQQITGGQETKMDLAIFGSRVEREVIGLQGGIMDQFAIMLCQPEHVMLLDCRTREYRHIDARLPASRWILVNTRVRHHLIDSDYNRRADECQQAVALVQAQFPGVQSLRDVTMQMLRRVKLPDILTKRSTFVVQENDRVHQMKEALQQHDAVRAGDLLKASHEGLRYQYEVSCAELDHLADFANSFPGVYGARMMGGGFGGCVICLLQESAFSGFSTKIMASYIERFGFEPEVIPFSLSEGVQLV